MTASADPQAVPAVYELRLARGRKYARWVGTYLIGVAGLEIAWILLSLVAMDSLNIDFGILITGGLGFALRRRPSNAVRIGAMVFCSLGVVVALSLVAVSAAHGVGGWWEVKWFTHRYEFNQTWLHLAAVAALGLATSLPPLVALAHPAVYYALAGAETGTPQRRRWIAVVVGLPILFGLGACAKQQWEASQIPECARPPVIEKAYARELERIRHLADLDCFTSALREENDRIFAAPEVLWVACNTHPRVTSTHHRKPGIDTCEPSGSWEPDPPAGTSLVRLGTCRFEDGTEHDAAIYVRASLNTAGKYVKYTLAIDLNHLRRRAATGTGGGQRMPP